MKVFRLFNIELCQLIFSLFVVIRAGSFSLDSVAAISVVGTAGVSFQASSSLPEAILASEDPASEEESSEAVVAAAAVDRTKLDETDPLDKTNTEASAKEKNGGKFEAKSGGKKSKNSYSIAALCQVFKDFFRFSP